MSKNYNRKNRTESRAPKTAPEFEQRLIDLARVTRVMAGGKRMRFRACVVIGDRKGKAGWGVAKGADVTIAISKAVTKAKKKMEKMPIVSGTIPHHITSKFKAAKVFLRPAQKGSGVIAGGSVRAVLELAGFVDINAKILGSNNKINNVRATFKALSQMKTGKK